MIQITPHMRIFAGLELIDFRKGMDGLAGICRNIYKQDPFSGWMFVFCNKNKSSIRILLYDGQGMWLCQKRLSKGSFKWLSGGDATRKLDAHEMQQLIWNGNIEKLETAPMWKPIL